MSELCSGELKIGNSVRVYSDWSHKEISGVVKSRSNVVVITGEDECYLGYSWLINCNTWCGTAEKTVTQKYGQPMTIEQYKAYSKTPEAKANRLATYKNNS